MGRMDRSEDMYSTTNNSDYVDIHGRNLKVMVADDGKIYVPMTEIIKTGFHIYPKSTFKATWVTKTMLLKEFQLHMLGVAKEFMIQNDIRSFNPEDIMQTIQICRDEILSQCEDMPQRSVSNSNVLGRTLLENPAEINKTMRSTLHNSHHQSSGSMFNRLGNNRESDQYKSNDSLRLPHQKNDASKFDSSSNFDHVNISKLKNRSNISKNNQHNMRNDVNKHNFNQNNRNFQNNKDQFKQRDHNLTTDGMFGAKHDNESKSSTDAEDVDYIRLSDATVQRIELQKSFQEVRVVYIDNTNDKQKYWVQLLSNEKIVLHIVEKTNEVAASARIVSPKLNEIYMAKCSIDNIWYRVLVQRATPVIKVHFIDFGNDAIVNELRELPKDLKSIPAQAVRITLSRPEGCTSSQLLKEEQVISVKLLKQFTDTTILVASDNEQRQIFPLPQQVQCEPVMLKEQLKYSTVLLDKEQVKIIAHSKGKFYLRNKEHHAKLKTIEAHIKDLPKNLLTNVEVRQGVLCKKDGEENLCRAVVRVIDDGLVTVHYIDFHSDEVVSLKKLYGITKAVANLPVALIESPQISGYDVDKFTEESESIVEEMILNQVKFNVSLKHAEFDLIIKEESLSKMLFPPKMKNSGDLKLKSSANEVANSEKKNGPKPEESQTPRSSTDAAYEKVLFDNMPCYEPPLGKRRDYMLTTYNSPCDFTVTPIGDQETDMLTRCTCIDIDDETPYEPDDTEIVLACYEGGWYRGAVLDIVADGKYRILFVEYGNTAELTKQEIRRLPPHLKEIPMIGLTCQMVGVSELASKRLEELLKPDNIYEIHFISLEVDSLIYTVDIPKVKEVLRKEGLV